MKALRFRLGEAIITMGYLALYLAAVTTMWGLLLPVAICSAAILVPAYLVSLLMWRHYCGFSSKKDRDGLREL